MLLSQPSQVPVAEDFPEFWTADTGNLGGLMEEITFSSTANSAETITINTLRIHDNNLKINMMSSRFGVVECFCLPIGCHYTPIVSNVIF